jgi:hypothetical protein
MMVGDNSNPVHIEIRSCKQSLTCLNVDYEVHVPLFGILTLAALERAALSGMIFRKATLVQSIDSEKK